HTSSTSTAYSALPHSTRSFFSLILPRPPPSTLFPYTTLFRSPRPGHLSGHPDREQRPGVHHRIPDEPGDLACDDGLELRAQRPLQRHRPHDREQQLLAGTHRERVGELLLLRLDARAVGGTHRSGVLHGHDHAVAHAEVALIEPCPDDRALGHEPIGPRRPGHLAQRVATRLELGARGLETASGLVAGPLGPAARGHEGERRERGDEQVAMHGNHSTVTLLARLRGRSTSQPRSTAT